MIDLKGTDENCLCTCDSLVNLFETSTYASKAPTLDGIKKPKNSNLFEPLEKARTESSSNED